MMLIVMTNMQRELKMHVGGFIDFSLQTLAVVRKNNCACLQCVITLLVSRYFDPLGLTFWYCTECTPAKIETPPTTLHTTHIPCII